MTEGHEPVPHKLTEPVQRDFAIAHGYNPDALSEEDMDMLRQRWNIVKGGNSIMLGWPSSDLKT